MSPVPAPSHGAGCSAPDAVDAQAAPPPTAIAPPLVQSTSGAEAQSTRDSAAPTHPAPSARPSFVPFHTKAVSSAAAHGCIDAEVALDDKQETPNSDVGGSGALIANG